MCDVSPRWDLEKYHEASYGFVSNLEQLLGDFSWYLVAVDFIQGCHSKED